MIRFILARTAQVGPDDFERQHKTVDADVPDLEALIEPGAPWYFQGLEVLPALEVTLRAEDLTAAPLAAAAESIEQLQRTTQPRCDGNHAAPNCGAPECWLTADDTETVPLPTPAPAPPPCDFQHDPPECAAGYGCYLDVPF